MKRTFVLGLFVLLSVLVAPAGLVAAAPSATVVISELQTRGPGGASEEFVELFNRSDTPIDVTGWRIMYLAAAGGAATTRATLSGSVAPHSFVLAAPAAYMPTADFTFSAAMADGGGHILVLDAANIEIDRVGWGTAAQSEGAAAAAPAAGQSLRREAAPSNLFHDTDNNAADFVVGAPAPQSGPLTTEPEEEPELPPEEPEEPPVVPCEGVILSEVGTNFVEVYNPTAAPVSIENCQLLLDGTAYSLGLGTTLSAGAYLAVDPGTDLSGLGAAVLVTTTGNREVLYPQLAFGQAWAMVTDAWQLTLQPTPGSANVVTTPPVEEPDPDPEPEQEPQPQPQPDPQPSPPAPQPPHSCPDWHGRYHALSRRFHGWFEHHRAPTHLPAKHQFKPPFTRYKPTDFARSDNFRPVPKAKFRP